MALCTIWIDDEEQRRMHGRGRGDVGGAAGLDRGADGLPPTLDIATLRAAYRDGRLTPRAVVEAVLARIAGSADPAVWISLRARDDLLADADALAARDPATHPLWGIPFAIKDNIDLAGLATTAACPAFGVLPAEDAAVVARLRAAGAIAIGKTNLDQFATGLVGTRSPHGAPRSVFDPAYVSGGSSSGSAVAVAAGQVAFSLGTDTAGSGRVPAAFNNLVGVKPSCGLLSTHGVLPACRTLDCVSVFATTVGDATAVRRVAEGFDEADPYSRRAEPRLLPARLRIGVPTPCDRRFFGDIEAPGLYEAAVHRAAALGHDIVEIDYGPFREAAEALYGGAWVAERLAAIEPFFDAHADAMDPAVREIIGRGKAIGAADAFRGLYAMAAIARRAEAEWARMDVLLLPTAPTIYTVAAVMADPIRLNVNLGTYTNFVNLLDCAAVAVPAGFRRDGLPFGVTLVAPAFTDDALAAVADRLHRAGGWGPGADPDRPLPPGEPLAGEGATSGRLSIAVVGAHLAGQPLNGDLLARGGRLERSARTAPDYRLYALGGAPPARPGLVRAPGHAGPGIEVEVWSLPAVEFAGFVAAIPAPLGVGKVRLDDGSEVSGFVCEAHGIAGARDITGFGGWRAFRDSIAG